MQHQVQLERGVRIDERNRPANTEVSKEGGGSGPGTRAEILVMKTMVRQLCPCSP